MEGFLTDFANKLNGFLPRELVVFLVSMLPIIELRGGIIIAKFLGMPWYEALPISLIGNLLPLPFILLLIRRILEWMKKRRWLNKIAYKLEAVATSKKSRNIVKYEAFGLFLFVAIPLPGTGGWTGALIAAVLKLRLKIAIPMIALGILTAGIVMTLGIYGIIGGLRAVFGG